jgi:ribonuclease E
VESMSLALLRLIGEEARKERTGRVITQVPVDVATYLMNEKREQLNQIESRDKVSLVIVPNPHMHTPAYTLRRVRDDEKELPENTAVSYQLADQPIVEDENIGNRDKRPPGDVPLVPSILPASTAPIVPMPVPTPAPAKAPAETVQLGAFVRLWRWLFGDGADRKNAAAAGAPPAASQRDRPQNRDARPDRYRSGADRDRNRDRGDRDRNRDVRRDGPRDPRRDGRPRGDNPRSDNPRSDNPRGDNRTGQPDRGSNVPRSETPRQDALPRQEQAPRPDQAPRSSDQAPRSDQPPRTDQPRGEGERPANERGERSERGGRSRRRRGRGRRDGGENNANGAGSNPGTASSTANPGDGNSSERAPMSPPAAPSGERAPFEPAPFQPMRDPAPAPSAPAPAHAVEAPASSTGTDNKYVVWSSAPSDVQRSGPDER